MADLPPCGLYRTATAHPERQTQVPEGRLIYFHNHSNQDAPIVLLPAENKANRWTFSERGYLVRTESWCHTLVALKPEGIYRLTEPFQSGTTLVPAQQLVQLGYNREAEPIIFFPRYDAETNALIFPTQGLKLSQAAYDLLEPVNLRGPRNAGPQVN